MSLELLFCLCYSRIQARSLFRFFFFCPAFVLPPTPPSVLSARRVVMFRLALTTLARPAVAAAAAPAVRRNAIKVTIRHHTHGGRGGRRGRALRCGARPTVAARAMRTRASIASEACCRREGGEESTRVGVCTQRRHHCMRAWLLPAAMAVAALTSQRRGPEAPDSHCHTLLIACVCVYVWCSSLCTCCAVVALLLLLRCVDCSGRRCHRRHRSRWCRPGRA